MGRNLLWVIRIEGQSSVTLPGVPPPTSSYRRPNITAMVTVDRKLLASRDFTTEGGTRFVVRGTSFGPPGVDVRLLFGSQWASCIADRANCLRLEGIPTDESLEYRTPEGVGANIPVAVYVGEELSNIVYFSYSPPLISRLVVEQDVGISNTTKLKIAGINFGGA